MQSIKLLGCICSVRALGLAALATAAAAGLSSGAQAQELTHRFINPSFGGNPFYSDHLLGIATIHRPAEPKKPAEPEPTEEELLAKEIEERFRSDLRSTIIDRIENAQPGQSGQFEFGNQRISFTRTATETRITFVNLTTNETRFLVIPVAGANSSALTAARANNPSRMSAEQALGAPAAAPGGMSGGSLLSPPPL